MGILDELDEWQSQTRMFDRPKVSNEEIEARRKKAIDFLKAHSSPTNESWEDKRKEWQKRIEEGSKWIEENRYLWDK